VAEVTVRYWAGARDAAGTDDERLHATSVPELVAQLCGRPGPLPEVVRRSALLVDGQVARGDVPLVDGQTVEVLPPFAGG